VTRQIQDEDFYDRMEDNENDGGYRGTLLSFLGTWGSGIAQLAIGRVEHGVPVIERLVPCENTPTARALIAAFDCAGDGHSIDNSKIRGKEIVYVLDDMGLLKYFKPAEECDEEEER
jgi:hypothetical protein